MKKLTPTWHSTNNSPYYWGTNPGLWIEGIGFVLTWYTLFRTRYSPRLQPFIHYGYGLLGIEGRWLFLLERNGNEWTLDLFFRRNVLRVFNKHYFSLGRRLYGWRSNHGVRLILDFPAVNAWTNLTLSMGIRRSKRWQFWPVRFKSDRAKKELQIGFGLVHFTLTFNH